MVCKRIFLHHFHRLQLLQFCLLGNLVFPLVGISHKVSYIGYVPDISHLISQMLHQPHKCVVSDSRTGVSQMCIAIDRRSADIKSHPARIDRLEKFLLA